MTVMLRCVQSSPLPTTVFLPKILSIHHDPPPFPIIVPRGGGVDLLGDADTTLDDSEIDRMVEELIAGVDGEGESGHVVNTDNESNVSSNQENEDSSSTSAMVQKLDDDVSPSSQEEIAAAPSSDEKMEAVSTSGNYYNDTPKKYKPPPSSIPTNAYYRFLVRRGPAGHIIASFSLLSIQWIYTYLPFVYKLFAYILLTLRIYDPKLLHVKEHQRRLREQRKRDRVSFSDRLKGTFSSGKKKEQKEADQNATSKLQQLYKTALATSLDWREIPYSYLSVGFRKRHGLGEEYVKKKPMKFMGEELGGEIDDDDGQVVVDSEEDLHELIDEQVSADEEKKVTKQQKRKRKITDWVVQSFGNQHFLSPTGNNQSSTQPMQSQKASKSLASIWKSAQRDDIVSAAWESRNAEKSIWTKSNQNPQLKHPESKTTMHPDINPATDKISRSGSSVFQSVMSRVGTNGRILGAYPMDAPPIEECSNRRGVLQLAQRYGYGDWKNLQYEEECESEDDSSWGGGDLFSDEG